MDIWGSFGALIFFFQNFIFKTFSYLDFSFSSKYERERLLVLNTRGSPAVLLDCTLSDFECQYEGHVQGHFKHYISELLIYC